MRKQFMQLLNKKLKKDDMLGKVIFINLKTHILILLSCTSLHALQREDSHCIQYCLKFKTN